MKSRIKNPEMSLGKPSWNNEEMAQTSRRSPGRWGCRICFGSHPTSTCDIIPASSENKSMSPRFTRPGSPGGAQAGGKNNSVSPRTANSKAFTRTCKFFAAGKCTKGANCTFLHSLPSNSPSRQTLTHPTRPESPMRRSSSQTQRVMKHPASLNLKNMNDDNNGIQNLRAHSPFAISRPSSRPSSRPTSSRNLYSSPRRQIEDLRIPPSVKRRETNSCEQELDFKSCFPSDLYNVINGEERKKSRGNREAAILSPLEMEDVQNEPLTSVSPKEPIRSRIFAQMFTQQLEVAEETQNLSISNTSYMSNKRVTPAASPASLPATPSKAFTRPCKYFAQGFCVKGAACTFLHSTQEVPPSIAAQLTPKQLSICSPIGGVNGIAEEEDDIANKGENAKLFVRLCRYFVKGVCAKGANCTFIHPTPEQLEAIKIKKSAGSPSLSPNISPRLNSLNLISQPAQSPRLCLNTKASPLRTSMGNPALDTIKSNKVFTKICKFYQIGQCLKGSQCTFIHEKTDAIPNFTNKDLESVEFKENVRVSSPRFARVDNRGYDFANMDDIEDYVEGLKNSVTASPSHSNIAGVLMIFHSDYQDEINDLINNIHLNIREYAKENVNMKKFTECFSVGCTRVDPEEVALSIRGSDLQFEGREEIMCQPRFANMLRWLKQKNVIPENVSYMYQIEAVSPKYSHKYPFANVSMILEKGDKGERIEEVAITGLFEEQHIILDRSFWDDAFKGKAPPLYLPYYLTAEQLQKYPDSRRTWFCGIHTVFVPIIRDAVFTTLNEGDEWPQNSDVPSKYVSGPVPCPTLYIAPRSRNVSSVKKTAAEVEKPSIFSFKETQI